MDGITGFVGPNGSGKTLAMMNRIVRPSIDSGRTILSNTPIFATKSDADLPWQERQPHPLYVPLVSWRQLSDPLRRVTICLDEISSMFDARESSKMPTQVTSRFQQLRKSDIVLAWSAPGWERADIAIRRTTLALYECSGHWPVKVEGQEWRTNRVSKWRKFDARKFDEFSVASAHSTQKGTLRPMWRMRYRIRKHDDRFLYDTLAPVNLLDHLDLGGKCIDCGGTRRPPACGCAGAGLTVGKVRAPLTLDEMREAARGYIAARIEAGGDGVFGLDGLGSSNPVTPDDLVPA